MHTCSFAVRAGASVGWCAPTARHGHRAGPAMAADRCVADTNGIHGRLGDGDSGGGRTAVPVGGGERVRS